MKWAEVVKDPRYQESNVDVKDRIKEDWYESNVKADPRYTPALDTKIRGDLFGKEYTGPSFREARLGTETIDREIQYQGKPTRLTKALKIEKAKAAGRWASKELKEMKMAPGLREPSPLIAPVVAYEQTYGRLFGGYRALLAGKSPIEGLIHPGDQPRAIESVIASDFSKRMGVDPAVNPEAATWINGLAGWALDLAGIHLIFNVPVKAFKEIKAIYTGAQGKAVNEFKSVLSSEFESAGLSPRAAKQNADILFHQQWVKTGVLKKTPESIRQSTALLNANKGKLGEFIKSKVAEASTSAAKHGYTPEVLKRIPRLSGKTTFSKLVGGESLTKVAPKPPVSSKIELTKPKVKLTSEQRLVQIKASHQSFKARKTSEVIKETTSEQKPVEIKPPKNMTKDDLHSSPHIPLKSGTKSDPTKPFIPEERAPHKMFQVELQTPKGVTITYVSEENLIKIKEAIQVAPVTKKLPETSGVPITKVLNEQELNITEMHLGLNPGPALREVKRLYEYMEKMTDPVRTSPPEVARTIRQRAIAQNVLIHNIAQVKSAMKRLVPDPKNQEIITAFIEPNGEAAVGDQMTDNMRIVADLIMNGQMKMGGLAKAHGVIKTMLDNYMKHLVKDPLLTVEEVDAKIKWALSTGKISKFVESKMPRMKTESGEVLYPTIASLEAAGYKVATKNAIDLYDFTMRSEGLAVINAELAKRLRDIPYIDPRQPTVELKQLMSIKEKTPPRGFKLLRRGVFSQQWASPEAYNAISTVAEPPIGGRVFKQIAGVSKRIKFLFPFLHAWNLWRNSVETRGIPGSFKMIANGAKQLEDPERISQILKMGVNLFRINRMSGGITDEFARSLGKWDLPAKTSEWLFCGLGDSVAAGMTNVLEKQLVTAGIKGQEANEVLSEIVNTLSGGLSPETMSRAVRDIGRVGLLARNWTISNIREGKGALFRSLPKYWSKEQKDFGQKWYASALLRGFLHLFTTANVINYMVSKHSYGEGRPTWKNEGRWDFKIAPLLWVDKKTGKEFYATGWYGSLGDIIHWFTRPITTLEHKLMIPVREGMQQLANRDFFTGEKLRRDSDDLVEGIGHRIGHAAESFLVPAGVQLQKGKYPIPLGPKVLRIFGLMMATSMRDQDLMKKMFNFKEKKRYKIQDVDRDLYKMLSEGDRTGFMKKASEKHRYQTMEGATGMIRKFENPLSSFYRNLSFQDRRDFLNTLSPSEKQRLGEAVRRKKQ